MKVRYTSLQFDAGTSELVHPECDRPLGGMCSGAVSSPEQFEQKEA